MGRKKIKPDLSRMVGCINPLTEVGFRVIITRRPKVHHDKDGNEVIEDVELEHERYAKVFLEGGKRKAVCSLGGSATKLFTWLMYELDSGKDYVWINRDRYMHESGISSINTYKDALRELVGSGLIAVSLEPGVFWINPRLFFCGNRIKKYPNHVEIYKPKKERDGTSITEDLG